MKRETKAFFIYLFGFIGGLITLASVQKDQTLRFHGAQSIVLTLPILIITALFKALIRLITPIPMVGLVLATVLGMVLSLVTLAGCLMWVLCMVRCLQGQPWRIPGLSALAERHVMHWFFQG